MFRSLLTHHSRGSSSSCAAFHHRLPHYHHHQISHLSSSAALIVTVPCPHHLPNSVPISTTTTRYYTSQKTSLNNTDVNRNSNNRKSFLEKQVDFGQSDSRNSRHPSSSTTSSAAAVQDYRDMFESTKNKTSSQQDASLPPHRRNLGPEISFKPQLSNNKDAKKSKSRKSQKRGLQNRRYSDSYRVVTHEERRPSSSSSGIGAMPTSIKYKKAKLYANTKEGERKYFAQNNSVTKNQQRAAKNSTPPPIDDSKLLHLASKGRIQKLRNALPQYLNHHHKFLLLQCAINGRLFHVAEKMYHQWPEMHEDPEAVTQMCIGVWGKEGNADLVASKISWIDEHASKYSQRQLVRNAYLNALVRNSEMEHAWQAFEDLFLLTAHSEEDQELLQQELLKESAAESQQESAINEIDEASPHQHTDEDSPRKVEPTIISFSTIMSGYASRGNTEKLEYLYHLMQELQVPYLLTDVYIHNLFLQAAVTKNDETLLWKYFQEYFNSRVARNTENNVIAPNIITVNHILKFYSQRGDSKKMEYYLNQFQREDERRRLNSRSALILLQGYYTAHDFKKAEEIFRLYYNYGIRKHSALFEASLEVCHLMLEVFDRTNQLDAMQELFDRMYLGRTASAPEKSTFEICIEAYKKRSSHDPKAAANLKKMQKLMEQYEKQQQKLAEEEKGEEVPHDSTASRVTQATEASTAESQSDSTEWEHDEEEDEEDEEVDLGDVDEDIEQELTEELEDFNPDEEEKERSKYLW